MNVGRVLQEAAARSPERVFVLDAGDGSAPERQHTFGDATLGAGATPLMRAAKSGDIELVRVLLEAGADPLLTLPNGTTPLMLAAGLGWRNGSPLAPSYDQGSDAEAVETLELLLSLGLDLQAQNEAGDTALHAAVGGRGSETIVRFLLQRGAEAVRQELISRYGIDAARLTAKGLGATKPVGPNDTPEGRQNNRRVELVKM